MCWKQACVELLATDASLHSFEDAVTKQPYNVAYWCHYLDAIEEKLIDSKTDLKAYRLFREWVGRRALALLPRSYKIWKRQWEFVMECETKESREKEDNHRILRCLGRALWTLHAYPRVWMEYIKQLGVSATVSVTDLRRTINRALQAVPVTQHNKLWPVILDIITSEACYMPLGSRVCLLQRYSQTATPAEQLEIVAEYYSTHCEWHASAQLHADLLNRTSGETYQQVWSSFVTICSQHPNSVENIPWREIVRAALAEPDKKQHPTESGESKRILSEGYLWTQLADSYIRQGQFELARGIYEEGMLVVDRVADFAVLFEAYLELEQGLLEAASNSLEEQEPLSLELESESVDGDWDILLLATSKLESNKLVADMEWAIARAEHLTNRRPLLLNAVLLRQNPNNIQEWLTRAQLFIDQKQPTQAHHCLEEALQTVDALQEVNGSPSQLVAKLAEVYEKYIKENGIKRARDLFSRICIEHVYQFRKPDDLAECWVAWIELELRQENWDVALALARQSIAPSPGAKAAGGKGKLSLSRSLKLWDLLLDLEESLGTVQTTKDAYNRVLELKAATGQHVLNFAEFLIGQKYFEESFTAFERGVELFAFPNPAAKLLWRTYLKTFLDRYKGTKIERARDLFQRCLESCPAEDASVFYLLVGEFEEEYGLRKRALSVYEAMCDKVPHDEKLTAYKLFIAKTTKYVSLTATRSIYQNAIEKLKDQDAATLCLDFYKMEVNLQQIERARGILTFGAQMADPRRMPEYWKEWNEFEISNGNEETFREMLRVKRSVEAAFSSVNYNAAGMTERVTNLTNEEAMNMIADREGIELEPNKSSTVVEGFVSAKRTAATANLDDVEDRVAKLRKATGLSSIETEKTQSELHDDAEIEIDIEELDTEIEEAAAAGAAAQNAQVPLSMQSQDYQVADSNVETIDTKSHHGALERLRAASKK